MVIQLYKFTLKNHWMVYLKQVNFMVCQVHLNKALKNAYWKPTFGKEIQENYV